MTSQSWCVMLLIRSRWALGDLLRLIWRKRSLLVGEKVVSVIGRVASFLGIVCLRLIEFAWDLFCCLFRLALHLALLHACRQLGEPSARCLLLLPRLWPFPICRLCWAVCGSVAGFGVGYFCELVGGLGPEKMAPAWLGSVERGGRGS
jgi:hypothetical protein